MEDEWSVKNLIKQILLSSTYKRALLGFTKTSKDEENKFYSYFPEKAFCGNAS